MNSAIDDGTAGDAAVGVIGLGVMGENLALNLADHGYRVAVWNRTQARTTALLERAGPRLQGTTTLQAFTAALARPRRIVLMLQAGAAIDELLAQLAPLLTADDVIVDGGNSFFGDTQRRQAGLRARGVHLVGMGVSGGAHGARFGPSLMPGGAPAAYARLRPVLEAIAARTPYGPCVAHVGPDGAGHFVKMVHNGIEYGVMQLIAETYDVLRRGLGLPAARISEVFAEWNRGPMESYLLDVASRVLSARDAQTGHPLVERILDQAEQKGTGKWTAQVALDLGVPVPTIAAALDARLLSGRKDERVRASAALAGTAPARVAGDAGLFTGAVRDALCATTICCYAQGMSLLRAASLAYGWPLDRREVARIWTGGCIIRARLLDAIMQAFARAPELDNLLLDPELGQRLLAAESAWRGAVQLATAHAIPAPALSASLAYFDAYRSAQLPQNLTQAQRDYFGAHTYRRIDAPGTAVHTDWDRLRALAGAQARVPSGNAAGDTT